MAIIESTQNPKIKQARALQRRRERLRESRLFVEGVRLVEDALSSGVQPDLLFFTRSAAADARAARIVAEYQPVAWEVSDPVMIEMSGTVTPQGIAAIVPLPSLPWPVLPSLLVVVDQVRDPGNLGTLVRSAAAAGVDGLIVPKGSVDPWNDKVLRAGMGAHFRLPIREGMSWAEVEPLLDRLVVRLADASGPITYDEADWLVPSALIVGGEAAGAGRVAAQRADETISIPMAQAVESLNAGVAGSVILFEAFRQRRKRTE